MSVFDSLPVPHDDGHWISERVSRIVELIREYDSRLDVRWIPPENREPGDAALAVIENTPTGPMVAFYVQDEKEFDERILARIYEGDNKHGNVLDKIEAHNAALRAYQEKQYQDQLEDAGDLAMHILRSPKTRYKHNGRVYE